MRRPRGCRRWGEVVGSWGGGGRVAASSGIPFRVIYIAVDDRCHSHYPPLTRSTRSFSHVIFTGFSLPPASPGCSGKAATSSIVFVFVLRPLFGLLCFICLTFYFFFICFTFSQIAFHLLEESFYLSYVFVGFRCLFHPHS